MHRLFLIVAALAGLFAVAFGAFGAHGLKPLLSDYQLGIWEKGVQYQIYHALALFMCAIYLSQEYSVYIRNAAYCFVLGVLCFSGSLYLLATADITGFPKIIAGPVTPIGGFFFIAGWAMVLIQALRITGKKRSS